MPKALPALDTTAVVCCAPISSGVLDEESSLQIALRLKALADPVRVRLLSAILAHAGSGIRTIDLAALVGLSEATVSHHLKQLREAGLIEGQRFATNTFYRPCLDHLGALSQAISPCC